MPREPTYEELEQRVRELEEVDSKYKHSRQAFDSSQNYLAKLNNSLRDAVFTVKLPERIIEYMNTGAQSIFGYSAEECVGKQTSFLYPDHDAYIEYGQKIQRTIEEGRDFLNTEHVLIRKNGERFLSEITTTYLWENDAITRAISIARDITERKQAEEALRKSEQKFRLLTRTVRDVFWMSTAGVGEMIYISPAYERLWERSEESLYRSPRSFLERVHPDDLDGFLEIIDTYHKNGRPYECEYRIVRKDGEVRWIHEKGYPVEDPVTKDLLMTGVCTDITERKHLDSEKARLEEQLRQSQKLESIGRLAGGIAHDHNNMISVILGYGENLLEALHPEDPLREPVEEIVEAGRRSALLTRQLLAFSRKQTLQIEVLDLNRIVTDLDNMLRRLIGEDIELDTHLQEGLECVYVDPSQIEQVILNLAINARDAMAHGGKLTIETKNIELDEHCPDEHAGVDPGKYAMLSITDTGCGMDAETCNSVFEPFFTTKERGKGTGLGLSTVYGIVKQSGGHIWVHSERGQGATFNIYFPQTIEASPEERAQKGPSQTAGKGEKVLVVEDEPSLRKLCEAMLTRMNYEVTLAANGTEALLWVQEKKLVPDLILTDVVMPGMSGEVLVQRLRDILPDLKALYMSGYTDDAIVHRGVLDPGVPFIQKPFSKDKLGKMVRSVLDMP